MIRVAQWIAALALCALHGYVIYHDVYEPYQCNILRKQIIARSEAAQRRTEEAATILARSSIERIKPCLESCKTSVDYYMLVAANLNLLGRQSEAELMYREALKYDKRPEIYFELGQVLLARGRRDEARRVLRMAGYSGSYIADIGDAAMRDELVIEMSKRDTRLRAKIRK